MKDKYKIKFSSDEDVFDGCPPGWYIEMPRFGFGGQTVISGFTTWGDAMRVCQMIIEQRQGIAANINANVSMDGDWVPQTLKRRRQ